MNNFYAMIKALVAWDQDKLISLVKENLDNGVSAKEILNQGLIAGMELVGEKMESGELFLPEVIMSAEAMSAAVEILKPLLAESEFGLEGKVVIGTVKGDNHDIGKNLVAVFLKSVGFEVYDIGVDVSPEVFVEEIREKDADMLAMSTLLTTTMHMMKETIDAVKERGYRDHIKIAVGGSPITKEFADDIGADGYASDAQSATKLVKALLQQK